jgi:hypothetical protein
MGESKMKLRIRDKELLFLSIFGILIMVVVTFFTLSFKPSPIDLYGDVDTYGSFLLSHPVVRYLMIAFQSLIYVALGLCVKYSFTRESTNWSKDDENKDI